MRSATAVAAMLMTALTAGASSASPPRPLVAIQASAQTAGGIPLAYRSVTPRTPMASMTVRIVGQPAIASGTTIRWSSPDGKNVIGPRRLDGGIHASAEYEAPASEWVEVYPKGEARGDAILVAEVGGSVGQRATLLIRDVSGLSFGCYTFTTAGPSVRFVGDEALRSSRDDADVAVVGPGGPNAGGPVPGCSGENYEPGAASYRLVFRTGGRIARPGRRGDFVRELPVDRIDGTMPLDVQIHDGRIVRLHVAPAAAGAYLYGWSELVDER